jgi:tetratricopeptide (TPR) repeat protein
MQPHKSPERVPLPIAAWMDRLKLPSLVPPEDTLGRVHVSRLMLQDYRPLWQSLEWELSLFYWSSAGILPFAENEVPFLINNSGRLSENAALLLFANCQETAPQGHITVLEFGAGTGLFARFFLDTFKSVCEQEDRNYYERLRYVVTDYSRRTVEQWCEREMFSGHAEQVVPAICDAAHPRSITSLTGEALEMLPVQAVLCNYVLDVLPCSIVCRTADGNPQQLCVRTNLADDPALLRSYTPLSFEQIRALAQSDELDSRLRLMPLLSLFDYEVDFRDAGAGLPYVQEALASAADGERVLLNWGAMQSLDGCAGLLDSGGFILVNDYGAVSREDSSQQSCAQRFGSTTASGINFPLLEQHLARNGLTVSAAPGDESRALHSRLITRRCLTRTQEAFHNRFSADAYAWYETPVAEARKHAAAGRNSEVLESYRTALSRSPRDWPLITEVAEFVGLHLKDYTSALELCRAALELNPVYTAWPWNVLGDCLYCQERYDEAHEAYLQAQRIDPGDGRTNLNLAYTLLQRGEFAAALQAIAAGLAADVKAVYRDRLLEKQQHVLAAISGRWLGEQDRLMKRYQRFS